MRQETRDASDSAVTAPERRAATPRGELARIRESQERQSAEAKQQIIEAMLTASGKLGYRNVAVRHVLEGYGGYRVQFYHHFAGKAECYAAAYEVEIERLCARLLDAAVAEGSWRPGLRAALAELGRFACERPDFARGLLVEVHVAGGPARAKREEVFERLSRAIDSARRETLESRHSPPPITAAFMVSAIEESVARALIEGEPERFAAATPELAHLVVMHFFGEEAAEEEPAASPAA